MTELNIKPGKYIVAVSGGVDSVVLLELLSSNKDLELVVAHFDHGIREESSQDRKFVEKLAEKKKLQFKYLEGKLGPDASEEIARDARYNFLFNLMAAEKAKAVITAHHQDDLIETAIINLIRGTNRKGLTSLSSNGVLLRPILDMPKSEVINYAKANQISWREDPSNHDTKYLRNKIRHEVVPKLSIEQRNHFLSLIKNTKLLNDEVEAIMNAFVPNGINNKRLERRWFINLPHDVAREVMASWLRANYLIKIDKKMINKLVIAAKTFPSGKKTPIYGKHELLIGKDFLALSAIDR
jgi:tRNA(Ile)-lysidine synthase